MNNNHTGKNKGTNLSVTGKSQKSTTNLDFSAAATGQSRARSSKYPTFTKLSTCSGGVCSLNWKPYNPVA